MKTWKKILALTVCLVMVLAMGVTVSAAEATTPTTYTITAPATAHQYEIYQIFTGDLAGTTLSNVKWGINGKIPEGKAIGDAVEQSILNSLTAVNASSEKEILAVVEQYADLQNPVATITNGRSYQAAAGYYLIKDRDGSVSGTDAYTTYIVKVVGNITITPKSDVPSSEKKVKDADDSAGTTSDWQDSADYDIGDDVPFKLKGTVADNYDAYETYKFVFHDKESAGLTFNKNSVKVYVDGNEITSDYTVETPAEQTNDTDTFDIVFENLKQISSVHANSTITVEYTSTLNAQAVLGETGNPNTMHLEFSNNPQGEGTGKTPDDTVIVFTYKTVINKKDENGDALSGAEFKLEKLIKGKDGAVDTWREIAAVKNPEGTTFTFSGLDDGVYLLTETATPAGYNSIEPIKFTVTANHTETADAPTLEKLTGVKNTGEITFTSSETKDSLTADVINKSGSSLPSTGGVGTTIFYVIGAVLMIGAGVLLIARKRTDRA